MLTTGPLSKMQCIWKFARESTPSKLIKTPHPIHECSRKAGDALKIWAVSLHGGSKDTSDVIGSSSTRDDTGGKKGGGEGREGEGRRGDYPYAPD